MRIPLNDTQELRWAICGSFIRIEVLTAAQKAAPKGLPSCLQLKAVLREALGVPGQLPWI